VALQLRKVGIRGVRPLLGGFHEWKKLGFPLVNVTPGDEQSAPESPLAAQGSV
jgi:3-mercaptopyruvate sulfurtransferase SseA